MLARADLHGMPYLGIFCIVNDNHVLVPPSATDEFLKIVKGLDADIVKMGIASTSLLGLFAAANNKKIIVTKLAEKGEIRKLKDIFPEVIIPEANYTALGNLISMNDHGAVCAPQLAREIGSVGIKVASSDLVGSSLYANNRAFLAHPDASDAELGAIKKALKIDGGKGTVNFGDPMVSSGIIGNKNGMIVGNMTTGPEMNRIDEIFILD